MQTARTLLDKARKTRSIASDKALAERIGVQRSLVSGWATGAVPMPDARIVEIAELAGEDPGTWLLAIHAAQDTGAVGRHWQALANRLGSMAASVLLTTGAIGALALPAWVSALHRSSESLALYIMLKRRDAIKALRGLQEQRSRLSAQQAIGPHGVNQSAGHAIAAA